ncbi:MAG TPA: PfkB family carbohydrate kinase [Flavisolibacter sp.]|nr:PfkB family carbohydrate kinase [Flavisolibacter sp.]
MKDLQTLFEKIQSIKVGVVGDVMLDTYLWGVVDRISPEAPVPVVSVQSKEQRIGGAGNVALNIASLGAQPFILTAIGKDDDGEKLKRLFDLHKIDTKYSITTGKRITTNKIRVISRNQQMMRLDSEVTDDLDLEDQDLLLDSFKQLVTSEKPDVVILQDYNKGVLTTKLIEEIMVICKGNNILTAVDPKRNNFLSYQGVDIFKPNLKEVRDALNIITSDITPQLLHNIHSQLQQVLNHKVSFITLSEKGAFYKTIDAERIIPGHVRNIADVSGAGDTVIAVAAMVYAASKDVDLMAEIANIAGGLVCEEVGTVAINRDKLIEECQSLLS